MIKVNEPPIPLWLGVDLGGTKIEAALLDSRGDVVARQRCATPEDNYQATLGAIAALIASLEKEAGVPAALPLGIATPGSPSPRSGLMRNCNSTALNGQALQKDLSVACQRPVRLANDANCFALSEATDGAAAGSASTFGVIIGTGVGGGICVNGTLLGGANSIAGEWGHNHFPRERLGSLPRSCAPARLCYCGRWDCVETWLSGPGIALTHAQLHGADVDPAVLASPSPDPLHSQTLELYHRCFAVALAGVINVLDPATVVLGGGLSNLPSLYREVPALLAAALFSDCCVTTLVQARHGDSSGVRGAAWLWRE